MRRIKVVTIIKTLVIIICAFAAVLFYILIYLGNLSQKFQEEITHSLSEISEQSTILLRQTTMGEFYNLNNLANLMVQRDGFNQKKMVEELKGLIKNNDFKRMGVIDRKGTAYTTDDQVLDLSDREYFLKSLGGQFVVSDTLIDIVDNKKINVFSIPIYEKNRILGVLFATRSLDEYQRSIEVKTFGEDGYSYIVKRDGDIVIPSLHATSFQDLKNIYDSISNADTRNKECVTLLKRQMEDGVHGYITFYNKIEKYMYYRPIGVSNWYLLTVVSVEVMNEKLDYVMKKTYIFCTVIVLSFALLFLIILQNQVKGKKRLEKLVYVDPITGGYSYEKFRKVIQEILNRPRWTHYVMIEMDVDKFKAVNDMFGYKEGNKAIRFIWKELKEFIREGEAFAHKNADSFVILAGYQQKEDLLSRLDLLCFNLSKQHHGKDMKYELIPSIGINELSNYKEAIDKMLDGANIARKSVKGKHRTPYAFFDEAIREKLVKEKYMEDRMLEALVNEEFFVCYQPKYDVKTKHVVGAEALVRWNDKERGVIVPPSDFIPLFEGNGFITEVDKFVFEEVCKNIKEWIKQSWNIVPVSVNLSQVHLYNINFVEEYKQIFNKYNIPSNLIQLELTESTLFENSEVLVDVIRQLHEIGFSVLMDDFGTGYSSLYMLKSVPVDILKLDKKFVDDIGNQKGESIIASIVSLAQSLKMKVIAEGVETKLQYDFMCKVDCDEIQGFYFSKPVGVNDFEDILKEIKVKTK